jgi:hypothetical protein
MSSQWKKQFSQLLNLHRISDGSRIKIHTAESLVPDPGPFEVEIYIAEWQRYKLPSSNQILAKMILAGGEMLMLMWSEEELPDQVKESIIVSVYR